MRDFAKGISLEHKTEVSMHRQTVKTIERKDIHMARKKLRILSKRLANSCDISEDAQILDEVARIRHLYDLRVGCWEY